MHDVELVVARKERQESDGRTVVMGQVVMARIDGHPVHLPQGGQVEAVAEAGYPGFRVTLSIIANTVALVDLDGNVDQLTPEPGPGPGKINNGPVPL